MMKKLLSVLALLVLIIPTFASVAEASSLSIHDFHASKNTVEEGEEFTLYAKVSGARKLFLVENIKPALPLTPGAQPIEQKLCTGDTCTAKWTLTEKDRVDDGVDKYFFLIAVDKPMTYDYFKSNMHRVEYRFRRTDITVIPKPEEPANLAPTAVIKASKTKGYIPFNVTLDGSESHDNNEGGAIAAYEWEIKNKVTNKVVHTDNNINFTYRFEKRGIYTATLTVTDNSAEKLTDSASIEINAKERISDDEDDDHDAEGGEGAGPGEGGEGGVGLPSGTIILENKYATVEAGKLTSVPIKILNIGSASGEFTIEIEGSDFGTIYVKPSEVAARPGQKAASYIYVNAYDGAAGNQYALTVKLLENGEVIDTETLFVEVEAGTSTWAVIGLVLLLLIAIAGLATLIYEIRKDLGNGGKSKQLKLEKYY